MLYLIRNKVDINNYINEQKIIWIIILIKRPYSHKKKKVQIYSFYENIFAIIDIFAICLEIII
jgi:hypothetical protein